MQNLAAKQHRNDPKMFLEIFKFSLGRKVLPKKKLLQIFKFSFWAEGFDKENEVSLGFKIPMSYTPPSLSGMNSLGQKVSPGYKIWSGGTKTEEAL